MERTISISAVGHANQRPDTTEITVNFETIEHNHTLALDKNADKYNALYKDIEALNEVLGSDQHCDIKTSNLNINRLTRSVKDAHGNYHEEFAGYQAIHNVTLYFPYDLDILRQVLSILSKASSTVDFRIRFTLKEPDRLKHEMLADAAKNAFIQAEALCQASRCKLGQLLKIDYSFKRIDIYSNSEMSMARDASNIMLSKSFDAMEIDPEDVESEDTVLFVWEIT